MLLKVEDVHKSFKKKRRRRQHVLSGVSFAADAGRLTLIKGKSGAGKSVLLSLLAGMDTPTTGRIVLDNFVLGNCSVDELAGLRAESVRLVFQDHNLIDTWTVMDNLLAADVTRRSRQDKIFRGRALLRRFEMDGYEEYYPPELSMGQQMRVTIARAMMVKPKLLLADEPTGELDVDSASMITDYLSGLSKTENICVVVSSHGHFPVRYADQVLSLEEGKINRTLRMVKENSI